MEWPRFAPPGVAHSRGMDCCGRWCGRGAHIGSFRPPSGIVLIGLADGHRHGRPTIPRATFSSSRSRCLLACLILSGVLSWLNLRGVAWRLQLTPPLRAGQEASVALALRNDKGFLPTYGLWFELVARPVTDTSGFRPESTWTGRDLDVRKILAQTDAARAARPAGHARAAGSAGGVAALEVGVQAGAAWRDARGTRERGLAVPVLDFFANRSARGWRSTSLSGRRRSSIGATRSRALRRPAGGERVARAGVRGRFVCAAALRNGRLAPVDPLEGEARGPARSSCANSRRRVRKGFRSGCGRMRRCGNGRSSSSCS